MPNLGSDTSNQNLLAFQTFLSCGYGKTISNLEFDILNISCIIIIDLFFKINLSPEVINTLRVVRLLTPIYNKAKFAVKDLNETIQILVLATYLIAYLPKLLSTCQEIVNDLRSG